MHPLAQIETWPAPAAAACAAHGQVIRHGETHRPFALASLTKLATAMAALVAHEEGTIDLDETEPVSGATVADLLAHSAGIAHDGHTMLAAPRRRRIYSTAAYEVVADLVAERAGMPFADYLDLAVAEPLGMTTFVLRGSAGAGAEGSVDDMLALAEAWRTPRLVHCSTLGRATATHLLDLNGVLPGFGRQSPNPWGLGPERRASKSPHWTGALNSTETFGHFGRSGTMLWIDPAAGTTLVALCAEPFGPWATEAWPRLSDDVVQWAERPT